MSLPVNEYFTTIQGEARFTGTPCLFIRLQGCDVGCGWCDTKHTWDLSNPVDHVDGKQIESDSFAYYSEEALMALAKSSGVKHVVLTGGEPATHDLTKLTGLLHDEGFSVQIETSGTYEIKCDSRTWVTVSPKIGMAGGRKVLESALTRANEIKHAVGKAKDLINLVELIGDETENVWLQPLSQNEKSTSICVKAAMDKGYKLSVQTHKYIGVR